MAQEILRVIADAEIAEAGLTPEEAERVRENVLHSLETIADSGFVWVDPGVTLDMNLPVDDSYQSDIREIVREAIDEAILASS